MEAPARQERLELPPSLSGLALALVGILVATGTLWAFQRGGQDFAVFHEAWRLVLGGSGEAIYRESPDRYLYAPGFAWLLAPLGLLPREMALALWCFAKAAVLGLVLRGFGARAAHATVLSLLGLGSLATLVVARPLLIDFRYGQVNVFILGACVWALLRHFGADKPSGKDSLAWAVLTFAALAKLFPLPLLLVPWVAREGVPAPRVRREKLGIVVAIAVVVLAPALTEGFSGTLDLHWAWKAALESKGLPLESHNQSFVAFLHHYFSGNPTQVISEHRALSFGAALLSQETIAKLGLAWSLLSAGAILAWLLAVRPGSPLRWMAVLIGLTFVPSHLVWKTYLVLGLPLAIVAATDAARDLRRESAWRLVALGLVFAAVNLTGFDFVGHAAGAHLEAAALLLAGHLALLAIVLGGGAGWSRVAEDPRRAG